MRGLLFLGVLPSIALAGRASRPFFLRRTDNYDAQTCEELGLQQCGTGCIPLDYSCCPDQTGGCPAEKHCVVGDDGQAGCCQNGFTCSGNGGVTETTFVTPTTTTLSSTEVPEPTLTSAVDINTSSSNEASSSSATDESSSTSATEEAPGSTSTEGLQSSIATESVSSTESASSTETTSPSETSSSSETVTSTETATSGALSSTSVSDTVSTSTSISSASTSETTFPTTSASNTTTTTPSSVSETTITSTTSPSYTTSTVYTTITETITSCVFPADSTHSHAPCRALSSSIVLVVTETVAVSTTICPVTATTPALSAQQTPKSTTIIQPVSKPEVICPGRGQGCYPATARHSVHSSIVPTAAANYTGEYYPTHPTASSTPSKGVVTAGAANVRIDAGMGISMVLFVLALIRGMF